MDRREFVQLLGAVSLVLAGGMVRMPILNPNDINRDRFIANSIKSNEGFINRDFLDDVLTWDIQSSKLIYKIASKFYDKLDINGKQLVVMSAPVELLDGNATLMAKTRASQTFMSVETFYELRCIKPELAKEIAESWIENVTNTLAVEFNLHMKDASVIGLHSIHLFQAIADNYEPVVGFKYRFDSIN